MKRLFAIFALLAGMPGWLAAQVPSAVERVTQALEQGLQSSAYFGLRARPDSIRILDSSQLDGPPVALHLVQLQPKGGDEFLAKLQCSGSPACIPFLVVFRCAGCSPLLPAATRKTKPTTGPLAVRQGERAQLAMRISGGNAWFPVVCLQAGAVGEVIRARTIDKDRVLAAVIVGPRQLRGVEAAQ